MRCAEMCQNRRYGRRSRCGTSVAIGLSKIVIRVTRDSHTSELIETRDFSLYGYIFDTQDEPFRTLLEWALNPADIDSAILQAERMYDDYIVRIAGMNGIQEGN